MAGVVMTQSASTRDLLTEIEHSVSVGRSLPEIDAEILASSGLNEESQATAWLYAWSLITQPTETSSVDP
jgi:hypothetical protein